MGASPRTNQRQAVERSRRVVSRTMTEAQFQQLVIDLAQLHGWRVAHFRAATLRTGRTVTPVSADGAGWPDLVLVHPVRGVLFRELKTDRGKVRPQQQVWLDWLEAAGMDAGVWRPRDWPQITATLTGRPA